MSPAVAGLWLVALVCAAIGIAVRAGGAGGVTRPPRLIRLARSVPAPEVLRRLADRPGTAALIRRAGLETVVTPAVVARARAGGACAGIAVAVVSSAVAPPLAPAALAVAAGGFLGPDRWLARRAARRAAAARRDLPDLLDLLGVCVGAGMPLDAALRTSADRMRGPLAVEVRRALRALELGTPRRAAYRELSDRLGSPELTRTVAALIQADELGAPIAHAVSAQAGEMRAVQDAAARESAARAAPKIQLVVALMMVPAVMLVVMAVLVTELARQVGAVAGAG